MKMVSGKNIMCRDYAKKMLSMLSINTFKYINQNDTSLAISEVAGLKQASMHIAWVI